MALCLLIPLRIFAQGSQKLVEGIVVDPQGHTSASASVSAWIAADLGTAGDTKWVNVDNTGHFQLLLPPGRYQLRAKDAANFYPDPSFLLGKDQSARFPKIEVHNSNLHGIVVKLGQRGALLKGDIRTQDGKPITGIKVTITDTGIPQSKVILTVNQAGQFAFVVPARPILIEAAAEGFNTLHYADGLPVTPEFGKTLIIDIQLISR